MKHDHIFTYIGIAAIALLLFGLAGFYLFLRQQTSSAENESNARGFSIGIPSYLGSRGSTAGNTSGSASGELGGGVGSAFKSFLGISEGEKANTGTTGTEGENGADTDQGGANARRAPRLWHVNLTPIAGLSFGTGSSTKLRYIERATGNVFEADPLTGTVVRLTNTLVPKSYEASIGSDILALKTFDGSKITTLMGRVGTTTQDGVAKLDTRDLGNVVAMNTPDSSSMLLLMQTSKMTHLIRTSWNASSTQQLLSLPAGDFSLLWPTMSRIYLLEKPASGVEGSLLSVSVPAKPISLAASATRGKIQPVDDATSPSEQLSLVLRDIRGLSALPHPTNESFLYSSDDGVSTHLFVKPEGAATIEIPLSTVADKCVWTSTKTLTAYCAAPKSPPTDHFMDRWYKGEVHTDDSWFTITAGAGTAEKLFTHDSDAAIDVENVRIDPSGTYLAFVNGRDKSLWVLRIHE